MPTPTPIAEEALLSLLDQGAVLITANSRLPLDLKRRHAAWRTSRGGAVWSTPTILPLAVWLAEATDSAILAGRLPVDAAAQRRLSAFEERVLWERVIGEVESDGLLDLQSLATAAQEAHELSRLWNIGFDAMRATEESRRFEIWRQAFEQECRRLEVVDATRARLQQIGWLADGSLVPPRQAILAGYTESGPLEDAFCAAVEAAGGELFWLDGGERAAILTIQPCRDAGAEVLAAARWAAEQLRADNARRLAIVVPNLASLRTPLIRALDTQLQPEAAWSTEAPRRLLNFSLGLPLASYPLVATALDLLAALSGPAQLELPLLNRLLRSAHWSAWPREADARSRLEKRLRKLGSVWVSPMQAAAQAAQTGAGSAADHLNELANLRKEAGRRRDGREWAECLPVWLDALGWPGARPLDSDEFQTREAFLQVLASLPGLDGLAVGGRLSQWRSLLARQCRERVFQAQTRHRAYVEVLGPLEAVGQRFDGLWVIGLTDQVLPAAPRPNPLLPPALQRERGLPHASPEREQAIARALLAALVSAASEVVLSHPCHEGDSDLRPSPLLASWGRPAAEFVTPPAAVRDSVVLETLADENGPPINLDAPLAGGSQVLAVQAQCPLAAFVRYRLHAQAFKEPSPGPDASQRGTLLHLALAALWQDLGSQAKLLSLNVAGARAAVDAAVAKAIARFEAEQPGLLGPRLAALETRRLGRLLVYWLDFEEARPPFRVLAVEQSREVTHKGLKLKLALDRLDELEDGSRIVLDYKTGKPVLADWVGPRLLSPQLPLYAREVAAEGPVAAVGFARLRVGDSGFLSAARNPDLLPDTLVPGQAAGRRRNPFLDFADFDALMRTWGEQLDQLAAEVAQGHGANRAWVDKDRLRWLDAWPVLRRTATVEDDEQIASP